MRYELLEHTADLMIKAYGKSVEECFENAAYAMFDQTVDASKIDPVVEEEIVVEGETLEEKLYAFLSELIFIMDVKLLVFSKFQVRLEGPKLICSAWGEKIKPEKHSPKREIKAVTYHMLKVDTKEPSATVIFDV